MRVILLLLFTIPFWCVACSKRKILAVDSPLQAKYNGDKFSIFYENEWQIDTSRTLGNVLVLHSPLKDEKDDFRENISIEYIPFVGQIKPENFLNFIKNRLPNADLIDFSSHTENALCCYKLIFLVRSGGESLEILQYAYLQDKYAYLLSFTQRTEDKSLQGIAVEMMESFQINLL